MKACSGPPGKLDYLISKKKCIHSKHFRVQTSNFPNFQGHDGDLRGGKNPKGRHQPHRDQHRRRSSTMSLLVHSSGTTASVGTSVILAVLHYGLSISLCSFWAFSVILARSLTLLSHPKAKPIDWHTTTLRNSLTRHRASQTVYNLGIILYLVPIYLELDYLDQIQPSLDKDKLGSSLTMYNTILIMVPNHNLLIAGVRQHPGSTGRNPPVWR